MTTIQLNTDGGWQIGDLIPLRAAFTTVASGAATDPTAVTFKIKSPAGVTVTYVYGVDGQLVKDSTGVYHVYWSITATGVWQGRWEGTGACQATIEFSFSVDSSVFY